MTEIIHTYKARIDLDQCGYDSVEQFKENAVSQLDNIDDEPGAEVIQNSVEEVTDQ